MKTIVSSLEILEVRIAPATLLTLTGTGTTIAHYNDVDGDHVTITATGGTGSRIFTSSMFSGVAPTAGHEQLQLLDFSTNSNFEGANIVFTVVHVTGGNGLANVGYINSTGHNLGNVTVMGDLGQIDAGSGTATPPAINALKVHSLGRLGTDTQSGGDLHSDIVGRLASLTVTHDVAGASVFVTGANGKIGPITIHGSLIGGKLLDSGKITSDGDMGVVTIDHNVQGGTGNDSGEIGASGNLASVKIGGSLIGGPGDGGGITAGGDMGKVTIDHDVQGGSGSLSEVIGSKGDLALVGGIYIGGSLIGGSGADGSGMIISQGPNGIGKVTIVHDMRGGSSDDCGIIKSYVGNVGLAGGIYIGGSLISTRGDAGYISSALDMGPVTIDHDVLGNIVSAGRLASGVHIGGSLIGGKDGTGVISSVGNMGAVTIGHDFMGGSIDGLSTEGLDGSGVIKSGGRIQSVDIGGSIISGIDASPNYALSGNATIRAGDNIGSLSVGVAIVGHGDTGTGASPVIISARGQHTQGATTDVAIGPITIGTTTHGGRVEFANILAGYDTALTAVNADAQIGPVLVRGDWVASNLVAGASNSGFPKFGDANDMKITGGTDTLGITSKIAGITIKGQVFGTPLSVSGADHFGFVAERIIFLNIGTTPTAYAIGLTATPHTDNFAAGETSDMFVHEV